MSAIVAAASAQARSIRLMRTVRYMVDESTMLRLEILADHHEQRLAAAGRVIVAASNAAGAGWVVEGAPRTWAVRWAQWRLSEDDRWLMAIDDGDDVDIRPGRFVAPSVDLRPTWDAANRLWVWGSAAHDTRPCAWPRPFARGADR